MAARINPKHDEQTRQKIQTSQLVNRLQSLANGEIVMDALQLRAAEILLKKTLPDLQAVSHSGDLNLNITHEDALEQLVNEGEGATAQAQK